VVYEIEVDASQLKGEGKELVEQLARFLRNKTAAEVKNESNKLVIESENRMISRKNLRVLLKKFLHQKELRDYFRVISGDGLALKIKERTLYEE
jgi:hypothetical protein